MGTITDINNDRLILVVLDDGTVLDVGPRALVGGDILGNGLVHLHALVSEEIHQPAEDLDHALPYLWRPLAG